jgi:hypothetical protein
MEMDELNATGVDHHEAEPDPEVVNGKVTDSQAFIKVPKLESDEASFEWKQVRNLEKTSYWSKFLEKKKAIFPEDETANEIVFVIACGPSLE